MNEDLKKFIQERYQNADYIIDLIEQSQNRDQILQELQEYYDAPGTEQQRYEHMDHTIQRAISPSYRPVWEDIKQQEQENGKYAPIEPDVIPEYEKLQFLDKALEDRFHQSIINRRELLNRVPVRDALRRKIEEASPSENNQNSTRDIISQNASDLNSLPNSAAIANVTSIVNKPTV